MSSIPSIFKKIHFSKINYIKTKTKKKLFLAIVIVNYKKINFKNYIEKIYNIFDQLSSDSFKIYIFDFSNKIDYHTYFNSNYNNIEIYLFSESVDLLNQLQFIYSEINSDFLFYINTDYEIGNFNILENLKLFTDKNVGGITFGVYRGENYIDKYRYVFKKSTENKNQSKKNVLSKKNLIKNKSFIALEIAKEYSITLFPVDEVFIIKRDLIKLIKRNYYKLFNRIKKKWGNDILSKIEIGMEFSLNNFYFIVNPFYHFVYKGNNQLYDKIELTDNSSLLNLINYVYFKKAKIFKLIRLLTGLFVNGFPIKDILIFKRLFSNEKLVINNLEIQKKDFEKKLIKIFKNY